MIRKFGLSHLERAFQMPPSLRLSLSLAFLLLNEVSNVPLACIPLLCNNGHRAPSLFALQVLSSAHTEDEHANSTCDREFTRKYANYIKLGSLQAKMVASKFPFVII